MKTHPLSGELSTRIIKWSVALLILLFVAIFFIISDVSHVTAKNIQADRDLKAQLPAQIPPPAAPAAPSSPTSSPVTPVPATAKDDLPDEIMMSLSETGGVSINEEPVSDLSLALEKLLKDTGTRKVFVSLEAHAKTPRTTITQTVATLKKAGIAKITVTIASDEGF
ncbi:hypothetical protein [Prosthecobacter sp.]|uniref:hypothetical protein n=1 Tax=Prosthecobacter sp. TaxID=1965333 RepID=UPI0037830029